MKKILTVLLIVLLVAGLVSTTAIAADTAEHVQGWVATVPGQIAVSVTDESGAPIPYAVVYLVNTSTVEIVDIVWTDNNGQYLFSCVPPGQYYVVASADGLFMNSSNIVNTVQNGTVTAAVTLYAPAFTVEDGINTFFVAELGPDGLVPVQNVQVMIWPERLDGRLFVAYTCADGMTAFCAHCVAEVFSQSHRVFAVYVGGQEVIRSTLPGLVTNHIINNNW